MNNIDPLIEPLQNFLRNRTLGFEKIIIGSGIQRPWQSKGWGQAFIFSSFQLGKYKESFFQSLKNRLLILIIDHI